MLLFLYNFCWSSDGVDAFWKNQISCLVKISSSLRCARGQLTSLDRRWNSFISFLLSCDWQQRSNDSISEPLSGSGLCNAELHAASCEVWPSVWEWYRNAATSVTSGWWVWKPKRQRQKESDDEHKAREKQNYWLVFTAHGGRSVILKRKELEQKKDWQKQMWTHFPLDSAHLEELVGVWRAELGGLPLALLL